MRKFEKGFAVFAAIAAVGIICFWVFGFKDNVKAAEISFFTAGFSAWIALISAGIDSWKKKHDITYY